jgi:hypothetical protein
MTSPGELRRTTHERLNLEKVVIDVVAVEAASLLQASLVRKHTGIDLRRAAPVVVPRAVDVVDPDLVKYNQLRAQHDWLESGLTKIEKSDFPAPGAFHGRAAFEFQLVKLLT